MTKIHQNVVAKMPEDPANSLGQVNTKDRVPARGWAAGAVALLLAATSLVSGGQAVSAQTLLNVSYDPTRELYRE